MSYFETIPSLDELEDRAVETLSRRDMRALMFHLLYAAEAHEYHLSIEALVDMFNNGYKLNIPKEGELFTMTAGIIHNRDQLDTVIVPLLHNWRFDRLSVATKLILRMALWELQHTQTSPSIIMNEAIELAKCFAELDAYKFINGILDEYVKKHVILPDTESKS